jgi:hypothetical protein
MFGIGGGKKPPKKPGTGDRPKGNPRPATQKPKRGNKPGS